MKNYYFFLKVGAIYFSLTTLELIIIGTLWGSQMAYLAAGFMSFWAPVSVLVLVIALVVLD